MSMSEGQQGFTQESSKASPDDVVNVLTRVGLFVPVVSTDGNAWAHVDVQGAARLCAGEFESVS